MKNNKKQCVCISCKINISAKKKKYIGCHLKIKQPVVRAYGSVYKGKCPWIITYVQELPLWGKSICEGTGNSYRQKNENFFDKNKQVESYL
jgi:hypothetical protein